jgi:hypothetical protein
MEYKVGDLVILKDVATVPRRLVGKLAIISQIIEDGLEDLAFTYDPTKPAYILYVDSVINKAFWEENEFEHVKKE